MLTKAISAVPVGAPDFEDRVDGESVRDQGRQARAAEVTGATYMEFAQTMVTQHTEIGNSYAPIAKKQGLPIATKVAGKFRKLYEGFSTRARHRIRLRVPASR